MNFLSSYFHLITRKANWFAREAGQLAWSMLLWPFRAVWAFFWFVGQLLIDWWESRRLKLLLWGTPALLAITASMATALTVTSVNQIDRAQEYLSAGRVAMRAESWSTAKLYYERAMELGAREPEAMFDLAIASEKTGDEARKRAVLQRLAPDDRAVYAPAHLWKATQILSSASVSKQAIGKAETQLKFALQLQPTSENAHCILGDLYFQTGLWSSAADHLRFSNRQSLRYRLLFAKATAAAGDIPYGLRVAESVMDAASAVVLQNPRNVEVRLQWGEAALLLERYAEAATILQDGLKLDDNLQLRNSLALVLIHWSDSVLKESPQNRPQAWQLLSAALEASPNELLIYDRIVALLKIDDQTAMDAEGFLKESIVKGRAIGMSHFVLGALYFEKHEITLAGAHLKQAFELLPNGAVVANNYAWYLVKSDPPEPDRALEIIDAAIEKDGTRLEYHDTRGHIYLALERWQDAIHAFEIALPALQTNVETHQGLATAYQQVGLTDLATLHANLANDLAQPQKP